MISHNTQQIQKADAVAKELHSVEMICSKCTFINKDKANSCQMCGEANIKPSCNQQCTYNKTTTDYYYNNEEYDNYDNYNNYHNYTETHAYSDEYYEGAEYYDYDEVDWDSAKKRLIRTQLNTSKKSKKKKKKKKSTTANNITDTNDNKQNEDNHDGKMIYNEKQDCVERIIIKQFDHPLCIRIMMMLNYDVYNNYDHKAWKFNITGNTSYKKCNYLLGSCRIDIFDKFTNKYWDSYTFLPCKYNEYRLDIVNNAYIPIFIKIKNIQYVEMGKRGIVRDIDTCILHYIAQFCLETRCKNLNTNDMFIPNMIENGIQWDIKRNNVGNKNKDFDYKSPVYHRKIWKLFDKYIANMHMLFHIIFEYLGYDRITNIIIEGNTTLSNITNECFNCIAYDNACIPRKTDTKTLDKVYGNTIEYDIDETTLKMDNKQTVKHYMNVGMIVNKVNYPYNLQRHPPFINKHYQDSVWIPKQNPMHNILKKSRRLTTITLSGKKHWDRN